MAVREQSGGEGHSIIIIEHKLRELMKLVKRVMTSIRGEDRDGTPDELSRDRRVIEAYPDYAQAYYERGNCYKSKELYDEAIKDYTKAIESDKEYANAYIQRGNCYYAKASYGNSLCEGWRNGPWTLT
jgi:tetratricopeptide (TPR) repeat protein